jgi:cytochrome c-type biogenesis protein CcmH/NrfG
MKSESLVFAVAGMFFGLIAGWLIGSQQSIIRPAVPPPQQQAAAAPAGPAAPSPPRLDEQAAKRLEDLARSDPANATPRTQLANLYFDAEKYDLAIKWYEQALTLDPTNPDVSTDLGVSYYYSNQPDRALAQFKHSLEIDPKHTKTMLNQGIVLAFGKQDLDGATKVWQQVVDLAPNTPEGQAARRALDSVKSAHPNLNTATAAPGTD